MPRCTQKMTREVIEELQRKAEAGVSHDALAEQYGISKSAVRGYCKFAPSSKENVFIEGKEQSYRENLSWAMEAAGKFLCTDQKPTECPNHSAYFLFKQAINEPKDFMAKVGQIESKNDDGASRTFAASNRKTLQDIQTFLDNVEIENETREAAEKEEAKASTRSSDYMRSLPFAAPPHLSTINDGDRGGSG